MSNAPDLAHPVSLTFRVTAIVAFDDQVVPSGPVYAEPRVMLTPAFTAERRGRGVQDRRVRGRPACAPGRVSPRSSRRPRPWRAGIPRRRPGHADQPACRPGRRAAGDQAPGHRAGCVRPAGRPHHARGHRPAAEQAGRPGCGRVPDPAGTRHVAAQAGAGVHGDDGDRDRHGRAAGLRRRHRGLAADADRTGQGRRARARASRSTSPFWPAVLPRSQHFRSRW